MMNLKNIGSLGLVLAAVLSLNACDQGPSPEVQARIDSLQTARDSLAQELTAQTQYVQNLSQRIEDAVGDVEGTGVVSPEAMEDRLTTMRDELEDARERLATARERSRQLQRAGRTMRDSLNTVIRDNNEALAMQRDSINTLVTSLDSVTDSLEELNTERSNLADRLAALEDKYYTVYYVVGTKDELMEQGVIEAEGGARVLLVLWKAGETLVPARDLATEPFEAVDLRETSTIPLPGPGTYQMVSRHDTDLVEPAPQDDGRFTGESLEITEPEEFWRSSRYLILVTEE